MFVRTALIAAALAFGISGAANADNRYFMMVFAAQAKPNVIQSSHTFAVFTKVSGEGTNQKIETATISWMPASLQIEPLRRDPVAGANLDLARTLDWARTANAQVSMWGPYPIKKDLYDMAVAQAARLAAGKVLYIADDSKLRGKGASNCIHAVSDMDRSQPELNSGVARGEEASKMVLSHFDPFILPSRASNRWLVDRLGINPEVVRLVNPDLVAP